MVKCYEDRIGKIEGELRDYIERYNRVKMEMMEQLDGKSDMVRDVRDGLQREV